MPVMGTIRCLRPCFFHQGFGFSPFPPSDSRTRSCISVFTEVEEIDTSSPVQEYCLQEEESGLRFPFTGLVTPNYNGTTFNPVVGRLSTIREP